MVAASSLPDRSRGRAERVAHRGWPAAASGSAAGRRGWVDRPRHGDLESSRSSTVPCWAHGLMTWIGARCPSFFHPVLAVVPDHEDHQYFHHLLCEISLRILTNRRSPSSWASSSRIPPVWSLDSQNIFSSPAARPRCAVSNLVADMSGMSVSNFRVIVIGDPGWATGSATPVSVRIDGSSSALGSPPAPTCSRRTSSTAARIAGGLPSGTR